MSEAGNLLVIAFVLSLIGIILAVSATAGDRDKLIKHESSHATYLKFSTLIDVQLR